MKRHIPNIITAANLFSGCLAVVFAFEQKLDLALYFVLLAAIFDFFDGFVARLLNAYTEVGKQLDSLADVISFGFAPSVMLYIAAKPIWSFWWLSFFPFLIVVFSAVRLAKFNVDTRQNVDFLGLPTPANAIFFISFSNLLAQNQYTLSQLSVISLIFVFSMLMVIETPLFSLKKVLSDRTKFFLISILILGALVSICWLEILAGVVIIPLYILLSFVLQARKHKVSLNNREN